MTIKLKSHTSPKLPIFITSLVIMALLATGGGYLYWNRSNKIALNKEVKGSEVKKDATPETLKQEAKKPEDNQQQVAAVNNNENKAPVTTPESQNNKALQSKPSTVPVATPTRPTTNSNSNTIPSTPTPVTNPTSGSGVYSIADAQNFVEVEILRLVNAERTRLGVAPLTFDAKLRQASDIRSREEAITSFVGTDHTRPDGRSWSTVLSDVGYTGALAWGENLAWGYKSQVSYTETQLKEIANKMFTGWVNSPGHYALMKDPKYNYTGVGVTLLNQSGRTYWFGIQLFAKR